LPASWSGADTELPNLHGETLTLEALRATGKPVILLFTDPNYGPCTAMFADVGRWQQEYAQKLTVALISRGEPEEHAISASEHGLANVLLQEDWEVSDAYGVDSTPSAVLVQSDGSIASPVLEGPGEVGEFLVRTIDKPARLLY
jgi:peroxiredoxin